MKINTKRETKRKVVCEVLKKTQEQWVEYFNKKKQKMISMQDIYKSVNDKEVIKSLRKDFKDYYLMTSTRIIYNKDNLKATIIHDADSKIVKQKQYKNISIPLYEGNLKKDKKLEKYLQALFNTKHKLNKILETLKKISEKEIIRIWTPSQSSRKDKPIRSVRLYFYIFYRFFVGGDSWCDDGDGYSHGVLSVSEPKARSKRRQSK